jgi:hypothetical protein
MIVGFTTTMYLVPSTTNVASSNPAHGEVYSIQHYVIKFLSDLRQVGGFLRFPPPIKLTATIILLKGPLNTIKQTNSNVECSY